MRIGAESPSDEVAVRCLGRLTAWPRRVSNLQQASSCVPRPFLVRLRLPWRAPKLSDLSYAQVLDLLFEPRMIFE
jgi:hypothetical protein